MSAPRRTPQVADVLADLAAYTGGEASEALESRLDELAALADRPAPPPNAELATLLAGAVPLDPRRRTPSRRRRSRRGALTAAAALLALGAGTGAAAANALPAPVQRVVAVFSEHFLPFQVPRPTRPVHRVPAGPASPTDAGVDGAPAGTSPAPRGGHVVSPPHGEDRAGLRGERRTHRGAEGPGAGPTGAPVPLVPAATGLPLPEPTATASPGAADPSASPTDAASADPSASPSASPGASPSATPTEGTDSTGRVQTPGDGTSASPSPTAGASPAPAPSSGPTAQSWASTPPSTS